MKLKLPEKNQVRKGITPVIAIVLLLMVTVGAVGTVYTQFNSLIGNPDEELRQQERDQDTEVRISSMESNVSSIDEADQSVSGVEKYGTLMITLQNTGSVSRNTTSFVLTSMTGEQVGEHAPATEQCFTPENSTILDPRRSYYCNTGIEFPRVTDEVRLEVLLTGSSKTWTRTCQPRTSGARVC